MGGIAALPLIVEVAFGEDPLDTGTLTWTDISDYVRRGTGIDFSRGWDTESDTPMPGRLTFTVNNETGDFTPGVTGSLGEVRNRLPVRVSSTVATGTGNTVTYDEATGWYDMAGAVYDESEIGTVVLWTGLVESWRISWENGVRSQVQVTAVDRWAAIRRLKIDGDLSYRIGMGQTPAHFWACTDVSGSTRLVDAAGGVDWLPTDYQANMVAAGTANPQGWLTKPVYATVAGLGEGVAPTMVASSSFTATGATSVAATFAAWLNTGGAFGSSVELSDATEVASLRLLLDPTTAQWTAMRSDSSSGTWDTVPATTGWHHMAITLSVDGAGAVTIKHYWDGALGNTDTIASGGWTDPLTRLKLYGGGVAYVGVWDSALSAAQILAQYQAGTMSGWTGETADTRAARLLTYVTPAPSLTTTGTFTSTMSKQDVTDKSLADALQECAAAEDGTVYMSTAGWPVLTSRAWRTSASLAFTIPNSALSRDVSWTLDDQQLTNSATVDRMVGSETADTVTSKNTASITTYGEQNKSLAVYVDSDAQLLERANAEANMWAAPLPRSSELSVDVLTKQATVTAATLFGADIGQRVAVSGMPDEAPTAVQFFIESIADRITTTEWTRTFTVSPRLDYFTVEDDVFGVIDSTYVLAF